jgi:hypothetical protein
MELLAHIMDRFVIHFFSSAGLVLLLVHILGYIRRRVPDSVQWIPETIMQRLVVAALCVFAGSALREGYDVSRGQPLAKAVTDHISWLLGTAMSVWAIYRLPKK